MNYRLSNSAIGQGTDLELSRDEYVDIVASMRRLYLAKDVEEKLDLLLENYFEYERALLDLGLRYSLFPRLDGLRMDDETQLLSRRTLNLLSAVSGPLGTTIPSVVVPFDPTEDSEIVVQLLMKRGGRITILKSPVDFDHFGLSVGFEGGVADDAQVAPKAGGKFTHCCWGIRCPDMCITCTTAYFTCDLAHCSIFCG